mgnify:CR=1 FL=1
MSKKELAIIFVCVFIIFALGFVLRVESAHISGIPTDEKAFYEDQNGLPYMYDADCYYNYRLTENYLDHGYLGDVKINGVNWDLHSYYPPGRSAEYTPLLIYLAAVFYKFMHIFSNVPLIVTCFWLPAIIGPISGLVAYFFLRRFTNEYGAVVAGILTVTIPFYFFRTVPGWFDTDMFNVFFPILIIWFILESVSTQNPKKSVIFVILSAFSTALFSIAWMGWFYVFYIVTISFLIYIVLCKLVSFRKSKDFHIKNTLKIFLIYVVSTSVFLAFLGTLVSLFDPFNFLWGGVHSTWPNIYLSVSELGKPSLGEVVAGVGPVFLGGIFGLLLILRILINPQLKKRFLNKMNWFFYLTLILWILIGFISLKNGIRFIMLLIPPLVISSGLMIGLTVEYIYALKESQRFSIFRNNKLITIISLCVILLVTVPVVLNVSETTLVVPTINDDMVEASNWLNENTSNDTVVFSDWSYGHFFTAFSDRPFSVDGGSSNSPRTYWIDKAFATDNETLALGIFRMLSTTGDKGYLSLDSYTKNSTKTAEILNNILGVDKKSALILLTDRYGFSQNQSEQILDITHPENSRPFVILTYGEMINVGYWIFYFGDWDFDLMKGYNCTYSHGNITGSENHIKTSNNVTIDLGTGIAKWCGEVPYCLIMVENGVFTKRYLNKTSDICIIFQMDAKNDVVINKEFENSTFTKLVLERSSSTYFKMAHENKDVSIYIEA